MSSKTHRLMAGLCFIVLLLSACSPAPSAAVPSSTPPAGRTSPPLPSITATAPPTPLPTIGVDAASLHGLTIRVWHAFAGSSYEVFTTQAARFNASNEWGITVDPTGYGDYTSLFDAVSSALETGNSPDLVAALPDQAISWDESHSVVDLAPYLADPAWTLGKAAIADIPPVFWDQDTVNGKLMGLPAQRSARYLFYNKTWARELGFQAPPANAADFRQQACAANLSFQKDTDPTNDGYGGWIVDTDWQTTYSWMLAFGGDVADAGVYGFRTDPNLAALQFIKKLYDDHCAWISTDAQPFDSFSRRSALFISGDLSELQVEAQSMSNAKNTDEWELIPFPGSEKQAVVVYGPSFTVLKSTPQKQLAAWLFARWLISPENQAQWVQSTGLLPLRLSSQDVLGAFRSSEPQWDEAVKALAVAETVPQLASWRKVRYVLEDGMDTIFQTNLPVAQLPSILTEMDALAEELNKK